MNGGNYTLYILSVNGFSFVGCEVINNRFGRDYRYGVLNTNGNLEGLSFSGNIWDDTEELMYIND
jgi:hypothetical protein